MGVVRIWRTLIHKPWHWWARIIAGIVLLDQALGTISSIPPSEGIVIACIGALFAPVPKSKDEK